MKLLFLSLSFILFSLNSTVSDYVGTWAYSINTPDGVIKGEMNLKFENDQYSGTISAYGQEYQMIDIECEGNKLNFKTNAAGYSSIIKGTFSDDIYTAMISVEGMEIPMKAVKEK